MKKRLSHVLHRCYIAHVIPALMVKHCLALLIFLLTSAFVLPSKAAPLSGTRTIGPTGDYASIGAAIADVQAQTLGGPLVLELQPAYVSTVETFPLIFTNLTTTAANTLTLRPQTGAAALSIISADSTAATVDLNGAQFVTLDGRAGGQGTVKQLTIANTSTSGVAMLFVNEASSNTVEYLTLQGVNTSASSGTIVFSTTTGANGNDNNTIDHCDIADGATTPANAIYSLGSTGTIAQYNSGNTISNCNIFNFFSATGFAGAHITSGSTGWSITGNSFYQTASRGAAAGEPWAILVLAGDSHVIANNYIGGSAPGAGGAAWTMGGTSPSTFTGIDLRVGTALPSSIQGNILRNFNCTGSSGWLGIVAYSGAVNVGTVTGNTIGSSTGTGSITVSGGAIGIVSRGSGPVAIANNTIGSITATGTSTSVSASLIGIQFAPGTNIVVAGNAVGSTTTPNSLNASNPSVNNTTGQHVTGILGTGSIGSSGPQALITGNTVANLNNNYAGTASTGQIRGIVTSPGVNTIVGNTVRNLTTTSQNLGGAATSSVIGISLASNVAGQAISQNIVHSLVSTASAPGVQVVGIYYSNSSTTGTDVLARNLVHSLSIVSASTSSQLFGMYLNTGTFTAQNNMVRVGLDASGASTAGASAVYGIGDFGATAGRKFYHNSIYVGGTQTAGTSFTVAFDSQGVGNTRDFRNNIFVNGRDKGGIATGYNYAVIYSGTGANPVGLTANNNLFLISGTGSVLGRYNGTDQTTLPDWQTATGADASTFVGNPLFKNPTGTAATVDLHLQPNTPANNAGVFLVGVTDDFDGQNRSHAAPDIGADEVLSSNANLSLLTLDSATLSPAFSPNITAYAASVSNPITSISATVGTADPLASVMFSGGNNLTVGANTFSVIVTAPDGVTTKTYTVTITRQSALETWRFTYFGTTGNTGNAANAADPYHTGVPNLAVFAVLGPNQDPGRVVLGLLPQPQITGGNYVVTFTQPAGVSGVTYGAEWSADLSSGSWTPIADTGTGTTHTFSVPIGSAPMKFVRLTVTPQ